MAYSSQVLKVEGQAGIVAEMVAMGAMVARVVAMVATATILNITTTMARQVMMVAAATIITVRTTAVVKNASGADGVPQAVPWGALWT